MLDFFLACVRKEPHLGLKPTLESDCDAPDRPRDSIEPPGPSVTIPVFFYSSSPCNNYFAAFILSPADPVQNMFTLAFSRFSALFAGKRGCVDRQHSVRRFHTL
jgi:hypothetical protein